MQGDRNPNSFMLFCNFSSCSDVCILELFIYGFNLSISTCLNSVKTPVAFLPSFYFPALLKITTIDGNGAEFLQHPNFKRPFINRISERFKI